MKLLILLIRKKWQTLRYPPLKTELNRLTKLVSEKIKDHKYKLFNLKMLLLMDNNKNLKDSKCT